MLKIPLTYETPREEVTVSLDEGTITLALPLDPRSAFRNWRRPNPDVDVDVLLEEFPADRAVTSGTRLASALALADEVRRLREQIASVTTEVDVRPSPEEARAIAAALVHFAGEAEAGKA